MTDSTTQQTDTTPHIISAWGPEIIGCLLLTQQGRVVLGCSKGLERLTTPDEDSGLDDKLPRGTFVDETAYPVTLLAPPMTSHPPGWPHELATRIEAIEAERREALKVVEQHTSTVEALAHYGVGMTRSAIYAGTFASHVALHPLTAMGAVSAVGLVLVIWGARKSGTGAVFAAMAGEVTFLLSGLLVLDAIVAGTHGLELTPILNVCALIFSLVAAMKIGGSLRTLVEARIKG